MNMGNALKSALVVVSDMMVVARLQYSRRVVGACNGAGAKPMLCNGRRRGRSGGARLGEGWQHVERPRVCYVC